MKPKETNEIRDIFLAPFGARLVLSVFGTFLVLATMVSAISFVIAKTTNNIQERLGVSDVVCCCFNNARCVCCCFVLLINCFVFPDRKPVVTY